MKAVYVKQFGDLDAMQLIELPDPVPAANEVLVRVKASGVNFAELRMRAGTYSGQEAPFIMGMESAGVVEAIGENVTGFNLGDRVFGRARGSHAEKVCFDAEHLMPLPDNLSFEEGAALPVGWLTAWHALYTVARLQASQRVLIEAIASSVGSAALQIALRENAWVAGTASRNEKVTRALAHGANAAYNYKTEDVAALVARDTDQQGVNIALMTIGEETAQATMDSMGMNGKIVMYGSTSGRTICFNLRIGMRNLQLLSMSISSSPEFMTETMPDFRARALPLFASGEFKPLVDCVLPLEQVAEAHRMIEARLHYGKIILSIA